MYVCFRKSSNIILANVFTEAVIRLDDFEVGLSVFEWLDLLTLSWLLLLASFRHFMGKTCWGTKFNVLYMLIFTLSCFRQPRSFYWNLLKYCLGHNILYMYCISFLGKRIFVAYANIYFYRLMNFHDASFKEDCYVRIVLCSKEQQGDLTFVYRCNI
jgi:hypothetical protein